MMLAMLGRTLLTKLQFVLLVIAAIAIAVVTTLRPDTLQPIYRNFSFYIMTALFLLWFYHLGCCLMIAKPNLKGFLREYGLGIFLCFVLAGFIFLSVPVYFRVLGDETNLLSISMSMIHDYSIGNITQAVWDPFDMIPVEIQDPKRPLFFSYGLFLLHLVLGYAPQNAFIFNFFALSTMFVLVFYFLKSKFNSFFALTAVLFIAAQPVVTQTATSGSFDLFYAMVLLGILLHVKFFLQKPSAHSFKFLWVHLLIISNIRYEGPVYFFLVLGLLWFVYDVIRREYFDGSLVYALTPFIFLPTYWQRFLIGSDYEVPEGQVLYSLNYFFEHSFLFLKESLRFDYVMPYADVINLIGLLGIIYGAYYLIRRRTSKEIYDRVLMVALLTFGVYWVVINAHVGENLTNLDGSRLWTFLAVGLSLSAVFVLIKIPLFKKKPLLLLVVGLAFFIFYHPISTQNLFANKMKTPREHRAVLSFLEKEDTSQSLIIAYRTGIYTALQYSTMSFNYVDYYREKVREKFNHHFYRKIYVIQEIEIKTGQPSELTQLNPIFKLKPVFEGKLSDEGSSILRISEVIRPA